LRQDKLDEPADHNAWHCFVYSLCLQKLKNSFSHTNRDFFVRDTFLWGLLQCNAIVVGTPDRYHWSNHHWYFSFRWIHNTFPFHVWD